MGYYTRAFCTSEKVPTIKELIEWAETKGIKLFTSDEIDLETRDWDDVAIYYRKDKLPILSEINHEEDDEACLMKNEIEEFKEFLSDVKGFLNPSKSKVIEHLGKTRFIVANQLPTSDIEDDGFDANGIVLQYFEKHCGGMIQIDGEGFYEGNKLIIRLE